MTYLIRLILRSVYPALIHTAVKHCLWKDLALDSGHTVSHFTRIEQFELFCYYPTKGHVQTTAKLFRCL